MRKQKTHWDRYRAGPIGKYARPSGFYFCVRIKRHRRSWHSRGANVEDRDEQVEVVKDNGSEWISLGTFKTADEALEILEQEVEIMAYVERAREGLK